MDAFFCEKIAKEILKDYLGVYVFTANNTIDYDLITEKGERIEVKTAYNKSDFDDNKFTYHSKLQRKANLFFLFMDLSQIKKRIIVIQWKYFKKEKKPIKINRNHIEITNRFDAYKLREIEKSHFAF